jgi:lipoic acid synthetase
MIRSLFPAHVKKRLAPAGLAPQVRQILAHYHIETVCQNARCPNQSECFARGTATFMILGNICTRTCRFCAVKNGLPLPANPNEPKALAEAARHLGLRHVVITSVTRDDLILGGAPHFARCILALRSLHATCTIEVLTPDFQGSVEALLTIVQTHPDIFNHNIETVPRLYPQIRPEAQYQRSLNLLRMVKELEPTIFTKSGIMVGLGETPDEVFAVLDDLRAHDCDFVTIGQYLAPSNAHHPVHRFAPPDEFTEYARYARQKAFRHVASGVFVRSSYHAEDALKDLVKNKLD